MMALSRGEGGGAFCIIIKKGKHLLTSSRGYAQPEQAITVTIMLLAIVMSRSMQFYYPMACSELRTLLLARGIQLRFDTLLIPWGRLVSVKTNITIYTTSIFCSTAFTVLADNS
jgi:hypothetical protein